MSSHSNIIKDIQLVGMTWILTNMEVLNHGPRLVWQAFKRNRCLGPNPDQLKQNF